MSAQPHPRPSKQPVGDGISHMLVVKEAVTAVAASHPEDCDCTTCRAADGDECAFLKIVLAVAKLAKASP